MKYNRQHQQMCINCYNHYFVISLGKCIIDVNQHVCINFFMTAEQFSLGLFTSTLPPSVMYSGLYPSIDNLQHMVNCSVTKPCDTCGIWVKVKTTFQTNSYPIWTAMKYGFHSFPCFLINVKELVIMPLKMWALSWMRRNVDTDLHSWVWPTMK